MGNRSLAGRMAAGFAKKAWVRVMDRVGGKLVSGMADTSSDAPDSRFVPKRDLYSKMVSKENADAGSESE
ncbi:MAG: hypothetical protein CL930_16370 [Deltaproteobacteria bacterium]|nr:hypothetical protein [Deltaproteobacteria bacterium]|tara:strand:- start:290 stop:499 length:210 start_codon:yes stop_codon:yes gene_type:complete